MPESPRTSADLECELRSLRYEVGRATEELDRSGVEKYDNRPRTDSTDDSEGAEWSIQKRIKLLAAERERMLGLISDLLFVIKRSTVPPELLRHYDIAKGFLREHNPDCKETRMAKSKLSEAQKRMILRAAKDRHGEVFIGRGQAKTAARLVQLGLATTYYSNTFTHKAVLTNRGWEVLADA
jgi:hypothetical protein